MEWNADFYEDKHGFVADYGKDLLSHVPDNPGQAILDLGCGTGALTQELLAKSAHVVGADASPDMVRKARMLHPDIDFRVVDACRMPWSNRFDVVFSNAVFHWISDQKALLENIFRVLKPQGRLVCEFGAVRNIHRIQQAFQSSLSRQKTACATGCGSFLPPTCPLCREPAASGFLKRWSPPSGTSCGTAPNGWPTTDAFGS